MNEPYEKILDTAISNLKAARQLLLSEISAYPGPIAGCDTHFNHLLSDRTRISNAIRELENRPFVPTPRVREPGGVSESR